MRLIDADELTEMVWRERLDTRERIADLIARQPTIERTVKRGKMIPFTGEEEIKFYKLTGNHFDDRCSECGSCVFDTDNFCAECGVRLKDGENNA